VGCANSVAARNRPICSAIEFTHPTGTFSVLATAKIFKLRTAKAEIRKGARAKLMLRFSKGTLKALRGALKKRETIKAKVRISVRDAAGNTAATRRTFKLKR
jgi:hypothetical protein